MKVLVTGGSGFIAAHCIDYFLANKHAVVTTVRSATKGQKILDAHPDVPKDQLSYVIVEDVGKPNAFDDAIKSDPPFDAVAHLASPFHYRFKDPKELLIPAIEGTTNILKAIKAYAPTVKRVALTSSFAAIINPYAHKALYNEDVWNPIDWQGSIDDPPQAYRGSKTLAEKAAWQFIHDENPNFDLVTLNPPTVFGPIVHYLNSLDAINESNGRWVGLIQGKWKDSIPNTGTWIWTDVRDLALAHVKALEIPEAGGKRFFITAGYFANAQGADIVKKHFPEFADKLPEKYEPDWLDPLYKYDNSRSLKILSLKYRSAEESIVDTIKSLKEVGA